MAAVLQCCSHLQHCQTRAFAPSTSQPCNASAGPAAGCRRGRQRRGVAAGAKGRRASGDVLSEQLAELLPEHTEPRVDDGEPPRGGKQKMRQNARKRQPTTKDDVEIYGIESGWAEDAFESPDDLSAVLSGLGAGGGGGRAATDAGSSETADSAAAGANADADLDSAIHVDLEGLELEDWTLEGFDDLVRSASDEDIDEDGSGETSWATDNYNFSDDEEAEEQEGAQDEDDDVVLSPAADLDFEDDDGWSVSAVPDDYRVEKAAQGSSAMREPEVGPAMQRLLDSMPAEMLRRLKVDEEAARAEEAAIDPRALAKAEARRKTHRRLRIISGTAGGKRLLSPQGDVTRPMMEMVRAAVFSMIQARTGGASRLPQGSRWLDLFAGTGSIGLEALSRGCESAVFVELDAWVTRACLQKNIDLCELRSGATVFTTKAESFLERAGSAPSFAGGAFDFISVCPPYLLVSYPQLFQLLEASTLAKPTSIILVEYPKRLSHEIPDTLCGLPKVRDRKYGRTFLALYALADDDAEADGAWEAYS